MEIKDSTLNQCLQILNAQKEHIEKHGEMQSAYYEGMFRMFEIMVSNNYENKSIIYFDETENTHCIEEEVDE